MSIGLHVTDFLNSTLNAVSTVMPSKVKRQAGPELVRGFVQLDMGVLIGLTGHLPGRLLLNADISTFANVAERMYGVTLEGEMLESFVGEIGNMVAGNAASELSQRGLDINISPPTVLVGATKVTGFDKGISVPLELTDIGELNIVVIMEEAG